jgi:hypothetical protein
VPASACDFDRYQKKCDREIAAREQAEAAPAVQRKSAKRARITHVRRARTARAAKYVRSAPRFATRRDDGRTPSSAETRAVSLTESVMRRRFRGFIDPRPVGDNAFEAMRRPHPLPLDFDGAMIVPTQVAQVSLQTVSDVPAAVVAAPKTDSAAVGAPAAPVQPSMTLASAESKPVVLAPLASKPAIAPPVAPPAVMQASVIETGGPAGPNRFSFHTLVLALCGALGAASALRFIVGA